MHQFDEFYYNKKIIIKINSLLFIPMFFNNSSHKMFWVET